MADQFTLLQQFPQLQLSELLEAFRVFDRNGDGRITKEELGHVLKVLGQHCTETELWETLSNVDGNGNGTIEFEEFVNVMMQPTTNKANFWGELEEELKKAFYAIDQDHNGVISREELRQVMNSLGAVLSTEEVQDMINQADTDGDGVISLLEFLKIMIDPIF